MSRPRINGLEPKQARVLLALRAGPCDTLQLEERFIGGAYHAQRLVRYGLAQCLPMGNASAIYQITPAGRQACPSRRQLETRRSPAQRGVLP